MESRTALFVDGIVYRLLPSLMCLTVLFFTQARCVDDIVGRRAPDTSSEPSPTPTPSPTPSPTPTLPPLPPPPPIPPPPPPDDEFPFTTEWNVEDIDGELKIILPLPEGFEYDFEVDWGDDQHTHISDWDDHDRIHVYRQGGRYTVKITGLMQAWSFQKFPHSRDQLTAVTNLGSVGWLDLSGAFQECDNLTIVVARKGEFTRGVTSMANMFAGTDIANPDVSNWDTTAVATFRGMFENSGAATPDVSNWETGNATDMAAMFESAAAVDDLKVDTWDTGEVTDMSRMFANTGSEGSMDRTPYLVEWDFSKVRSMEGMLTGQTLPTQSYSNMLAKISEGAVMKNVHFDAGNSRYNAVGVRAKHKLNGDYGWTIYDGGADPN